MFALFEAGSQVALPCQPHVSAPPHVGLTMCHLFEVVARWGDITMFALFEAGNQVVFTMSTPRFGSASRGANHVSPLRGGCAVGLTMFALIARHLVEVPHG